MRIERAPRNVGPTGTQRSHKGDCCRGLGGNIALLAKGKLNNLLLFNADIKGWYADSCFSLPKGIVAIFC